MKVLLVGEYSRLHNSLKEGLTELGHEVILISTGDYFKDYPSDIKIKPKFINGFSKKIKVGLYLLFKIDITSLSINSQFFRNSKRLVNYDVVQLINENPFGTTPEEAEKIVLFLKANNKKLFLLSCGTDYISVKYAFDKKLRYSILNPFFEGKMSAEEINPALKYLEKGHISLHKLLYKNINGVIASDMDYHIPLLENPIYKGLVPNPVNIEKLKNNPVKIHNKIVIFHGINRSNYFRKGNDFFEAALEKIKKKYPEKVEVITVENIPYKEYIEKYNKAHIILDQCLSYDQGYNALEAMAKGKVVFTGVEKELEEFYGLTDTVAINALPDVDYLVNTLEDLILNPEKIEIISQAARKFVEDEHNYIEIAKRYLSIWQDN